MNFDKNPIGVGKKVRVVTSRSGQFGEEGVVVDFDDSSFPFAVQFKNALNSHDYFKIDELELASETKEEVVAPKINQQTLDTLQDFQHISEQLAEFNEKYNTKLRIIVE
jgi:hypothetical protein